MSRITESMPILMKLASWDDWQRIIHEASCLQEEISTGAISGVKAGISTGAISGVKAGPRYVLSLDHFRFLWAQTLTLNLTPTRNPNWRFIVMSVLTSSFGSLDGGHGSGSGHGKVNTEEMSLTATQR